MIPHSTLVLGGARSGKTRHALSLGETFKERYYIATAEAGDGEMAERIERHKAERGDRWTTVEAMLDLPVALLRIRSKDAICVVDCLTLWLSNLLEAERDVKAATAALCHGIQNAPASLVLVSNEIGLGLVPDTPLGRAFRDEQGRLNQAVAEIAERVEFVAAGLPVTLK